MEIDRLRYQTKAKKNKSSYRWLVFSFVFLLLAPSGWYIYSAFRKPLPALVFKENIKTPLSQTIGLTWPDYGQAAIGSAEEGVLAKSQAKESPLPTASIAKVITALAVLQKKPMDPGTVGVLITLDQTDVNFYNQYAAQDGSVTAVVEGEQITEYQALEAMMLPSSNNMADSMAFWAFGSIDAYLAYADTMIKSWGLPLTKVTDASGFSVATVSTPSELVEIGRKVLENPILSAIVAENMASIPVAGDIRNTNIMLGNDNIVGIKTGHTEAAGGCMLFAARHEIDSTHSITIIGAVQGTRGQSDSFTISTRLLHESASGFAARKLIKAGYEVGSYTTAWGSTAKIIARSDIVHYGWTGSNIKTAVKLSGMKAPIDANKAMGTLHLYAGKKSYSTALVASSEVSAPSSSWRLLHYFR